MTRKNREVEQETEVGEESATDYASILNRGWDDLPEDKMLPNGPYVLEGRGGSYRAGTEKVSPQVTLIFNVEAPLDGVDTEALADAGGEEALANARIFHKVWIERPSDWRKVKTLLELMGVDMSEDIQTTLKKKVKGARVIADLEQNSFVSKGNTIYENKASNFQKIEA